MGNHETKINCVSPEHMKNCNESLAAVAIPISTLFEIPLFSLLFLHYPETSSISFNVKAIHLIIASLLLFLIKTEFAFD